MQLGMRFAKSSEYPNGLSQVPGSGINPSPCSESDPAILQTVRHESTEIMIHATVRITLPSRKAGEAVEILSSVAERTKVRPGCISCRVYHDVQRKHVILIEEVWAGQEELERHLRSSEYRKLLLVLEMALEKPEIRFITFSHSSGVEAIEEARQKAS